MRGRIRPSIRSDWFESKPAVFNGRLRVRAEELEFERAFLALTPGRRDLWIEVGRRHRLYAYGTFGGAVGTAPTLRDWVHVATMTRDLCFSFADYRPVERDGHLCGVEFCMDTVPADLREMTLYRDLGASTSVLSEVWQGSTRGFCLELALSASHGESLQRVFPFKVEFDCARTILVWPFPATDKPLPHGSEHLHRFYLSQCAAILEQIPGNALEAAITRAIMVQPAAHATIEAVARRLNMSVRTLQRRLNQHGVTFRTVLSRAHTDVAKSQLRMSNLSIAEIAAQLGYADRTSFDLAFSRWTGTSPRRYRDAAPPKCVAPTTLGLTRNAAAKGVESQSTL